MPITKMIGGSLFSATPMPLPVTGTQIATTVLPGFLPDLSQQCATVAHQGAPLMGWPNLAGPVSFDRTRVNVMIEGKYEQKA
jgi:hypothetical protein